MSRSACAHSGRLGLAIPLSLPLSFLCREPEEYERYKRGALRFVPCRNMYIRPEFCRESFCSTMPNASLILVTEI
ncbi:hypothetical protein CC80DRAFT_189403 [Byssothecium circinans]|uniref:Uncharacterized protein n=1 Tax=Byssothecium circinans TaxID=147558 RepID=A0A6A5TJT7_9PLEO|nr:hypothetical protein CC80DRAFT_189403 [Byssothecium circinans]